METVTIPKARLEKLERKEKKLERMKSEVDWDLVQQFDESLQALKAGRVRQVA